MTAQGRPVPGTTPGAAPEWHSALAYSLTGQWLAVTPSAQPDADALLAELAGLGWARERLAETARQSYTLPPGVVAELGAARFWAVLVGLRERIGASGRDVRQPASARPLTPDERRLAADRPPHW